MYSIMIVDDELIVQRAISHLIETYCPQIQVVGKTGSGMEAVSLALEEKPDIILMDIELAGLNGLEAASEIKKALPETIFIIISAYDNFQYAKRGISLGVMDYLLKPVSKDDLIAVLTKAVSQLEEERGKTREKLELREKLTKMRPFLEEDLFFSLLYPGVGMHPLQEYPQLLDFKFKYGQAVEVYVTDCNLLNKNMDRFKQLVRNQLAGVKVILFSPIIGRTALMLIGYETSRPNHRGIWPEIHNQLKNEFGLASSIILGRIYEGFEGMICSLRELRNSAQFYNMRPGVYDYEESKIVYEQETSALYDFEQEFFEAVKLGRGELARLVFNDLLRISKATFKDDLQSLKDYFRGIIAVLRRIFFETVSGQSKQIWDGNQSVQRIKSINDPGEIEIIFDEIIMELTGLIASGAFPERNPEIRAAVEYMEQNYSRDITLSDIATAVSLSPSYLAKLFKEYRNQTVMDFLERVRIENALKLLKETQYSIKEIAGRIGYKDPNYFSKVFKKVTNTSPTDIRR